MSQYNHLIIKKPELGKNGLCFAEVKVLINPKNMNKFTTWWGGVETYFTSGGLRGVARQETDGEKVEYIVDFTLEFEYENDFFGVENKKVKPANFDEVFDLFKGFWVDKVESFVCLACSVEKGQEILENQFGYPQNEEEDRESSSKKSFGGFR